MGYNIAIDGPAGAGKSTIARKVAETLSFIYVDTGAMYRAMAYYLLAQGVDGTDEKAVSEACPGAQISIRYRDGEQRVILNGEDVTAYLRAEETGKMESLTSAYAAVREHLLMLQRTLAKDYDVVMDGRDIGTTILPGAQAKIYLTATVETRAMRRYKELVEKGQACDFEEIKKDIADRDSQDMNRKVSPLRQAEDAVYLDSSDMTIEEVKDKIIRIFREKAGQ